MKNYVYFIMFTLKFYYTVLFTVFFASTNYLKMQRHFPKVAAGNSSKLHKLPEAC